jgi:hypothetical protein
MRGDKMVYAMVSMFQVSNKVLNVKFYDDEGNEIGSRGVNLRDNEVEMLKELTILEFEELKNKEISILSEPETLTEKIVKRGYDEWIIAKEQESKTVL